MVHQLPHLSLNFAMPKSQTFARPLRLSSTLDDFKSLHGYHSVNVYPLLPVLSLSCELCVWLQIMMVLKSGNFCGQVPVQNLWVRVVVQISQCIRHIQGHLEKLHDTTQQLRNDSAITGYGCSQLHSADMLKTCTDAEVEVPVAILLRSEVMLRWSMCIGRTMVCHVA